MSVFLRRYGWALALLGVLILVQLGMIIGHISWVACFASDHVGYQSLSPDPGVDWRHEIKSSIITRPKDSIFLVLLGLPYILLFAFKPPRKLWTRSLSFLFIVLPAIHVLSSFLNWDWHDCDRKGCTFCDGAGYLQVLLFPFGVGMLIAAIVISIKRHPREGGEL